jgi:hypothetical protein
MKLELTNDGASSKNVVSSLALRVQPSLASRPTFVRACIDPRLNPRIVDPHYRFSGRPPPEPPRSDIARHLLYISYCMVIVVAGKLLHIEIVDA